MAATKAKQEAEVEVEKQEVPLDTTEEEAVEIEVKSEDDAVSEVDNEAVSEESSEQEQEQYSKAVQKRINKLTKRVKDTEREREEAVRYAQTMKSEADTVKSRLQSLDQSYISEYGSRISAEQSQAEAALKNAVETGDSQATVEAQRKLTQLAVAEDRYNQAKAQQEKQKASYEAQANTAAGNPGNSAQAPLQQPDPKAEKWASKNDWFGDDYTMTFAAFGIHKKLVEEEGFDPKSNSYYDELDKRIKSEFSHKFKDEQNETGKKTAQTVAGVSRGSKAGRNKVRLTPSQVTIAKKLGVPLEEYAKHVKG
jgi:hypothetical protein|tara:strand:+ start:1962 stop:2891 length:930 start_codon:yes stop_codon:yes gene_type:complete